MNEGTGVIVTAGMVASGTTLLTDISKGNVTVKPIVAGFLLVSGLLLVATFDVDLANGFAVLIMATALVRNGSVLASVLSHLGSITSTGGK